MNSRNTLLTFIVSATTAAIVVLGGTGVASGQGSVVPPNPVPSTPKQPIAFSHKTHIARKMQCQQCHPNPAPGAQMTIAATTVCMGCHSTTKKDSPEVKKIAEANQSKKPIEWVRVYKVLPGVKWAHKKHLDSGLQCQECHGDVSQMDAVTEITSVTTKVGCLNCHGAKLGAKAKQNCTTCHPWFEDPKVPSKS